jgi:hypothetical protein
MAILALSFDFDSDAVRQCLINVEQDIARLKEAEVDAADKRLKKATQCFELIKRVIEEKGKLTPGCGGEPIVDYIPEKYHPPFGCW